MAECELWEKMVVCVDQIKERINTRQEVYNKIVNGWECCGMSIVDCGNK